MAQSRLRFLLAVSCSLLGFLPLSACKSQKSDDAATANSAEPVGLGGEAHNGEHEHKREPPPAAFDACQGKGVGDVCTATFGQNQFEAKCAAVPDGRLACRPGRGKQNKAE